jgi:hypothetical protein
MGGQLLLTRMTRESFMVKPSILTLEAGKEASYLRYMVIMTHG